MKLNHFLKKIAPAVTMCLAMALSFNANTAACYFFNQPETPDNFDRFRRIK